MKKNQILLALILFIYIPLTAQVNKNGIPLIKNYSPNDYNANEQNWAVCEDNRGVVYVGNTDGVLEFDGNKWRKIRIANGSIARSLAYHSGTVYVGGINEFGYLAPGKLGDMQYISLSNQLDTANFNDVWKIFTLDDELYFCCDLYIFKFANKKLEKVYNNKIGSFLSFKVHDKIYWGNYEDGIYELTQDSVVLSNGGEFFKEMDIFIMLPWNDNEILVGTIGQGIYIYNSLTGLTKDFKSLGQDYQLLYNKLNSSQIYNGIKLSGGDYAVATLNNGCIVFSNDGEVKYKLDKDNGLQDITAINLFESSYGHLWIGLNKGLSFVELNTPFTKLGHEYGLEGIITDVVRFENTLVVSTNVNLYYLDYNNEYLPFFKNVPLEREVWDLSIFKDPATGHQKLLLGSELGLFIYNGKNTEPDKISDEEYQCRFILQSKINPKYVYLGTTLGVASIEYQNGKWIDHDKLNQEITSEVTTMVEDLVGNLWLGTTLNGIIKINKDSTFVRYGLEKGLPAEGTVRVYYIDGKIVSATNQGLYYYNEDNDEFQKYEGFGEKYVHSNDEVEYIDILGENEYWIISTNKDNNLQYIEKVTISQDRIVNINNLPFKRLINNSFYKIAPDKDNGVWIASSDALYNYQERLNEDFTRYYNSLIRKVEMGFDSIVFYGTYYEDTAHFAVDLKQPDQLKITTQYRNNSFVFYYSSPYMPVDEIKYSYKLEGFDVGWSSWDNKTEKEYTNLNNGHYKFLVKAKNIYDVESEAVSYEFTIKPPWYKTIVAYLFYMLLAVFIIIVIVKIYTRRLELEKIRLEQIVKERTEEVVKQKEEIEQQRDEIADKNRSITDSIEYASRIQTAVLPSDEFAQEILPEHFILFRPRDIVSGDFYWMTKRDNQLVLIAADCTGHGVPGAFMSMLGVSFLNEIVNRHEITEASAILNSLRTDIKKTLGQEGKEGEAKDGMDIALCIVDLEKMKMQYAGAYNPLYLYRNNELMEVKADRMPIGIYIKEKDSFTNNEIDLQKGDVFYLFSDGFQDQFGGEDGSKFKTKNFKKLLLEIHQKPMAQQREILDKRIDEWRGKWEQVDDIIVMGVRV